jgi:serine/threonine-protein kinase
MTADRHLLFGLLALQNGIINQGQLLAAFQAWTLDRSKSLADHLADRGDIDDERRATIEALAALHIKLHGGDPGRSLAALNAGRSTRESLARLADGDIEASLAHLGATSIQLAEESDRTASYGIGTATSDGSRFRVLRPHARGGLGAVFVALDTELHREVALKQMLDHHADDASSRQRFLVEAEVTGGLEHPGIVPVYGLGTYGDGRPYYAMRLIRGDSLKEAIDHFHGEPARVSAGSPGEPGRVSARSSSPRKPRGADAARLSSPKSTPLALRKLLRRFLDVCNAIDYAHSRGVLHRDIKPGNIIVGKYGETLVVDWGLAKALGRSEPGSGERTLVPSSVSGSAETLPGSALGTPAYMSPEQAAGDLDRLGPRSDVYSLGATLYCLLTGKPPFEGDHVGEVLRKVQRGEFRPQRAVDPAIDRALEAVCLKAMSLRAEDRYPTPKALSEDIERWMADEPVAAWREPVGRRARRWARRHRTSVAAAAVLLVAAVAALAIGTVLVDRQRRRAEENFQIARQAVDDMYTQVAERWLEAEPLMESLQREFLEKALAFYERFAREPGRDPAVRREAARAARRVGGIHLRLERPREAESAFRRSLEILGESLAEAPDDTLSRADLARSHERLGSLMQEAGRFAEAEAVYRRGLALVEPLAADRARTTEVAEQGAEVGARLASLLLESGRPEEAESHSRRALDIRERRAAESPGEGERRERLANTLGGLGALLVDTSRAAEAEPLLRRSIGLYEDLTARDPKHPMFWYYRFYPEQYLSMVLRDTGRADEAQQLMAQVVARFERLAADSPAIPRLRERLARGYNQQGLIAQAMSRLPEAERAFRRELAVFEGLVRAAPTSHDYRYGVGFSHQILGRTLAGLGRWSEAEAEDRAAVAAFELLTADMPEVPNYRLDLGGSLENLAIVFEKTGRPNEAEATYRRALGVQEELTATVPRMSRPWHSLSWLLWSLCRLHEQTGRPADPGPLLRRILTLAEAAVAKEPDRFDLLMFLGVTLGSLGDVALARGDAAEARRDQQQAVDRLRRASQAEPANVDVRRVLRKRLGALAWASLALGQSDAADAALAETTALPVRLPVERYDAACYLARCVSVLRANGRPPDGPLADRDRAFADRAIATLLQATDEGYRLVGQMDRDPDLDPLRDRPDFRLLMMDLAFPAEPFSIKTDGNR